MSSSIETTERDGDDVWRRFFPWRDDEDEDEDEDDETGAVGGRGMDEEKVTTFERSFGFGRGFLFLD